MNLPQHQQFKNFDQRLNSPFIMNPSRFASGADFEDDFSSDTWTDRHSANIGIGSGILSYDIMRDGSDDTSYKALGFTLDNTAFVWRVKKTGIASIKTSGSNPIAVWGLSNGNEGSETPQDFLGHSQYADGAKCLTSFSDGAVLRTNGSNVITEDTTTRYWESIRLSATSWKVTAYANSDFTSSDGSQTETINSTIQGLDTARVSNVILSGGATYDFRGNFDDWEVYDGVTSV